MLEKFGTEENKDHLGDDVEKPVSFELDEAEKERLREMISEKAMLELNERIDHYIVDKYKSESLNLKEDTTVDRQCLDRFGLSWAGVRKQIVDNTRKPVSLLETPPTHKWPYTRDSFTITPRDLLHTKLDLGGTRNWMTNFFMETLDYIYASGEKFDTDTLEWFIKNFNEYVEREDPQNKEKDTKNQVSPVSDINIKYWIPIITNLAIPEKIRALREIHSDVMGDIEIPKIIDPAFEVKKRKLRG